MSRDFLCILWRYAKTHPFGMLSYNRPKTMKANGLFLKVVDHYPDFSIAGTAGNKEGFFMNIGWRGEISSVSAYHIFFVFVHIDPLNSICQERHNEIPFYGLF